MVEVHGLEKVRGQELEEVRFVVGAGVLVRPGLGVPRPVLFMFMQRCSRIKLWNSERFLNNDCKASTVRRVSGHVNFTQILRISALGRPFSDGQ